MYRCKVLFKDTKIANLYNKLHCRLYSRYTIIYFFILVLTKQPSNESHHPEKKLCNSFLADRALIDRSLIHSWSKGWN